MAINLFLVLITKKNLIYLPRQSNIKEKNANNFGKRLKTCQKHLLNSNLNTRIIKIILILTFKNTYKTVSTFKLVKKN